MTTTTTLWIVGMIAVAVIGAWVGGLCVSAKYGVALTKILDRLYVIPSKLDAIKIDALRCVNPICKRRNTPDDVLRHMIISAGKSSFIEEHRATKCVSCHLRPDCNGPVAKDAICPGYTPEPPSEEEVDRFEPGDIAHIDVDGIEQANIESAESAKVNGAPDCDGDDCRLNFRGGGRNG